MAMYTTTQCVRQNLHNLNQKHPKVLPPKFPNQFIALLRKGFTEKMLIEINLKNLLTKYSCLESEFSEIPKVLSCCFLSFS
jgi:hypothetical protein